MVAEKDHRSELMSKEVSKGASEKRIAANRKNAQKSTGPRTTEGKAASRMNAVRHGGLCSTLELLPGEDAEAFDQLRQLIRESLRPTDAAEGVLVDQYVSVSWKLRRLGDVEAAMNEQASRCESPENRRERMVSFGLPATLAERFAKEPEETVKSIGALLLSELRKGNGPRLQLIAVEERLRRMLGRTIRELKELRLLKRMMKEDEREAPAETSEVKSPDGSTASTEEAGIDAREQTVVEGVPKMSDVKQVDFAKPQAAAMGFEGSGMLRKDRGRSVVSNEPNGGNLTELRGASER